MELVATQRIESTPDACPLSVRLMCTIEKSLLNPRRPRRGLFSREMIFMGDPYGDLLFHAVMGLCIAFVATVTLLVALEVI